jgi:3-dehydroquinate synthase
MNKIKVSLDKRQHSSYDIYIGNDIIDRMGLLLAKNRWGARYIIISDANVAALYGEKVMGVLKNMDIKADLIVFPSGESSKSINTCTRLVEQMMEIGADRTSAVIALGGGVVGDVAGFTASIYMRGIPYIQVPTTLLAQVDSSIGGKTGVDTQAGKNIIGTFNQPRAVFIDVAFLKTLEDKEFRNGLAEIVKYGVIEAPDMLTRLSDHADDLKSRNEAFIQTIIARCCRIKKGIVEIDEKETGLRRILNFGHTIGHAIEAESGYSVTHGEGVSIGMAAAAIISGHMKYLSLEDRDSLLSSIGMVGLADKIPRHIDLDGIMSRLKHDKKKQGDKINFVLLKKLGIPFMNGGVPERVVRETLEGLKDEG